MIQAIITKIKDGRITLPKELQAEWKDGQVVFMRTNGGFLIKSITPASLETLEPKLRKLGKLVPQKNIEEAVKWAKKKTYAGRS